MKCKRCTSTKDLFSTNVYIGASMETKEVLVCSGCGGSPEEEEQDEHRKTDL